MQILCGSRLELFWQTTSGTPCEAVQVNPNSVPENWTVFRSLRLIRGSRVSNHIYERVRGVNNVIQILLRPSVVVSLFCFLISKFAVT